MTANPVLVTTTIASLSSFYSLGFARNIPAAKQGKNRMEADSIKIPPLFAATSLILFEKFVGPVEISIKT